MKHVLAIVSCAVLAGCATVNPMAFDKSATTVDTSAKSVVLMTIDVSRPDDSRYVPNPFVVKLERPGAQSKAERQNFTFGKDDAIVEAGHTVYLARMALEPGPYRLGDITGNANAFPIISQFMVPLLLDLQVKPNSITYVGRVSATLRPRQESEFRAGPLIPLIDQAVSGMSSGTWDVTIDNLSQRDVATFRANYPALAQAPIDVAPLPPFDRAAVQRWWDGQQANTPPATATASPVPVVAAAAAPGSTVAPTTSAPAPLAAAIAPPATPIVNLQPGAARAGQSLPFRKQPRGTGDIAIIIPAGAPVNLQARQVNGEGAWWFAQYEGSRGWVSEQGLTQ